MVRITQLLGLTAFLLFVSTAADGLDIETALAERVLGEADAPVTVVLYESLTCSHCAAFHAHTYAELKARYVDSGEVKVVVRQFLRNNADLYASMLTRCVPEPEFSSVVDTLFEQQDKWATKRNPVRRLKRIAKNVGLSSETFEACLANDDLQDGLIRDHQRAASEGVTGTPSFIINGELYVGGRPIEEFAQLIEPLLAQD